MNLACWPACFIWPICSDRTRRYAPLVPAPRALRPPTTRLLACLLACSLARYPSRSAGKAGQLAPRTALPAAFRRPAGLPNRMVADASKPRLARHHAYGRAVVWLTGSLEAFICEAHTAWKKQSKQAGRQASKGPRPHLHLPCLPAYARYKLHAPLALPFDPIAGPPPSDALLYQPPSLIRTTFGFALVSVLQSTICCTSVCDRRSALLLAYRAFLPIISCPCVLALPPRPGYRRAYTSNEHARPTQP
ncbi:uncharacterized protein PSFLO_07628 [Pseudozyma flocculosa]|uniref:Uncharacterized protein n=1 Tax=Pseudozyma flocculosa TaxID=84751 RepID=A0A5C3FES1_9BASI|nr:uncharacterized protein PSFLO_07628 [Pseudozyma flocculosa]